MSSVSLDCDVAVLHKTVFLPDNARLWHIARRGTGEETAQKQPF